MRETDRGEGLTAGFSMAADHLLMLSEYFSESGVTISAEGVRLDLNIWSASVLSAIMIDEGYVESEEFR